MTRIVDQIRALRLSGHTIREIAERVGCSFQYVHQVVRDAIEPSFSVQVRGNEVVVSSPDLPPELLAIRVELALSRMTRRRSL